MLAVEDVVAFGGVHLFVKDRAASTQRNHVVQQVAIDRVSDRGQLEDVGRHRVPAALGHDVAGEGVTNRLSIRGARGGGIEDLAELDGAALSIGANGGAGAGIVRAS